ncbi:hypothetical protein ABBQ32_012587 [Trebouxia sp. C0010 RCD-2024]
MLCQPRSGDFSRWTDRLFFFFFFFFFFRTDRLVQSRSLFVHISGSSGVLDGCLPEGNGHLPCNTKKKKKKAVLWCHHDALASIHTALTGTEDKLELVVNFFFFFFFFGTTVFFFFFWVTGEMSIPFRQAAVKDARRT